jgi:hypothetical protein
VVSQNFHRRHLTPEHKRELIAAFADWSKSDRAIATELKTNKNLVGKVRKTVEGKKTSTVPGGTVEKRTGKDGKVRKQPAKKQKAAKPGPVVAVTATASPSTEQQPAATRGGVDGGAQAPVLAFHDLDGILQALTNRSNGAPKADRIDDAQRILKALRITAQDLMPPGTGQPPRRTAPAKTQTKIEAYRCDRTIDAFDEFEGTKIEPSPAPVAPAAAATADGYSDAPKEAA